MLTTIKIQNNSEVVDSLILAPVTVAGQYQNQEIGEKLIQHAHSIAQGLDFEHIVLLGYPEYYPRFGYRPVREFGFTFPNGETRDACMAIELVENSLANVKGEFVYSEPFHQI